MQGRVAYYEHFPTTHLSPFRPPSSVAYLSLCRYPFHSFLRTYRIFLAFPAFRRLPHSGAAIQMPTADLSSPTSRHELDAIPGMPLRDDLDDEGAPPQIYRDDDEASVHSDDDADAILVNSSEASDQEDFPQEPYHARKYIPTRLQRAWRSTVIWVKGPQPPRPWRIRPLFPSIQIAPVQFLNNYFPKRKHKISLLIFFYFCWFLSFSLVLHRSAFSADIPGYGSPVRFRCNDRLW